VATKGSEMNKMTKMATIVAGVGMMACLAGCGGPESEYQDLLDKAVKLEMIDKAKESMEEFKKMTPEKQQAEIKEAKIWTAAAEADK